MDNIERAIRNALEKGDPGDRAFREKVYRSAFAALERTLSGSAGLGEETRVRRRAILKATISRIESEHIPAVAADTASPRPAPRGSEISVGGERDPGIAASRAGRTEPSFAPEPRIAAEPRAADVGDRGRGALDGAPVAEGDEERVRRAASRNWSGLIAALVVVAALAGGAWWAYQAGLFGQSAPPAPVVTEQDAGESQETVELPPALQPVDDADWTTAFSPRDPTTVTASGDASASVIEEEGATFLRIRSGGSGTPVRFEIGRGILESIAGGRAVFSIMARASEEASETQISVDCDFAALGDCGRRRYLVGITREEFLFEIELPNANPGAAGTISINSDIEGRGRAVDIHAIRVAPARR